MSKDTSRAIATEVLVDVISRGRSLTPALARSTGRLDDPRERALARELCFGVMRRLDRLRAVAARLVKKLPGKKDEDISILLFLGIYQLLYMRLPPHAAVAETVTVAASRGKPWAKALVNAVLRNFQRQREELLQAADRDISARFSHPRWLIDFMQKAWPEDWQGILAENDQRAPMTLRVNARRMGRDAYLEEHPGLGVPVPDTPSALRLHEAREVNELPGFAEGVVSVQDGGAQFAPKLLALAPGLRVLDACAAPGGKSAHILEQEPGLASLTAVERDPVRFARMESALARLGLAADLICQDAADPDRWWDGRPFDRILLDVPCSGTGIIRRRPDIKFHRRPGDIPQYAATQTRLLEALWPLLKPGGRLLYVTCSVLPQENRQRVRGFLDTRPDAREIPIDASWGRSCPVDGTGEKPWPGRQILPGENGMDGFYYAVVEKV